ncbi:hypothetical protein D3C77_225490 [compost metagenome]
MRLEKHQVGAALLSAGLATKEVLETDFEDFRCRGVTGDMPAQVAIGMIGPYHHGQRVPAQQAGDPLFQLQIPRIGPLLLYRQGIAVGREGLDALLQAQLTGMRLQLLKEKPRTLRTTVLQGRIQRIEPLGGFARIAVGLWIITQAARHTFTGHKAHHCHHCIGLILDGFRRRPSVPARYRPAGRRYLQARPTAAPAPPRCRTGHAPQGYSWNGSCLPGAGPGIRHRPD